MISYLQTDDPFDDVLVNLACKIMAVSIPKILIHKDGTIETIHSDETLRMLEEIRQLRFTLRMSAMQNLP